MKTELRNYTVRDVAEGFVYNELEGKGLYGLNGKLTIQQISVFLGQPGEKVQYLPAPLAFVTLGRSPNPEPLISFQRVDQAFLDNGTLAADSFRDLSRCFSQLRVRLIFREPHPRRFLTIDPAGILD